LNLSYFRGLKLHKDYNSEGIETDSIGVCCDFGKDIESNSTFYDYLHEWKSVAVLFRSYVRSVLIWSIWNDPFTMLAIILF